MKNGLLEKDFKLRFGLKLCAVTALGLLTFTLILYMLTSRSLQGSYGEAIYTIYDLRINVFPFIFASFYSIFILAVVTASIAVVSVFFSHKIAGPLYRLDKSLEAIGSGDLTVYTRFRGYDQLKILAEELNEMTRRLNHRVRSCGDALDEVKRAEERLAALLEEEAPERHALMLAVEDLRRGIEGVKKVTSDIKA